MLEQAQVTGVISRGFIHEEAARQQAGRLRSVYEHHEFQIGAGTTDPTAINSVVTHSSACSCARTGGAFDIVERAQKVIVRNMGPGAVKVRWNAAANDYFTIDDGEYLTWDFTEVTDIFIENDSGVAVDLRVAIG